MSYLRNKQCVFISFLFLTWFFTAEPSVSQQQKPFVLKKHNATVEALAVSEDGKLLATGGEDKMIYLWNLPSGELAGSISHAFTIKALEFTADNSILAACGKDVVLMDQHGKIIRTFSGYTTDVWSFSYHEKKNMLVAGSYAKTIKVWNYASAESIMLLEGHERSALSVCISPLGETIATGSLDKSVRLWDAETGEEKHKMEVHSGNIFALAFHPSGKYVASASADKTIRLWSVDDGKIVKTYAGHDGAVFDIQFSADGNHLISCDANKTVILWETATGKKLATFNDHDGVVNAVRLAKDMSGFFSASDDQTVRYQPLDRKLFLAESFYEKEIEREISQSPLFDPRGADESRQDYNAREVKASNYLDSLYEKYYLDYIKMLNSLEIKGTND